MSTAPVTNTRATPRALQRITSIAETVTWAGLITALVLRAADVVNLVFPAGLTHGIVFVATAAITIVIGLNQRWPVGLIAAGVAVTFVPFATIPFDRWLERRGRLEGGWRTRASDDPRDARPLDRLLRTALRNPLPFIAAVVVGVVVVVFVLLQLGPPTEWGR